MIRMALLTCCSLAVCRDGAVAANSGADESTAPTRAATVLLADSSGAAPGTQSTTGGNVILVDPSANSVSLERQLSWGIVHTAGKISSADLVRLNADNAPRQRELFAAPAGRVRVTEYGALEGEFAARYIFAILDAGGAETGSIALTSFKGPTQIDREMGRIGEDVRLFHLEDYRKADNVTLLAVYENEPAYEVVRARVLAALSQ
jgi:hypothetical protein